MTHYDLTPFRQLIRSSRRILQIAHISPDGDTLGSNLALQKLLCLGGYESSIVCIDTPGSQYDFLPGIAGVQSNFEPADYDLIITVDVADLHKMTGFYQRMSDFFEKTLLINIDHHASNNRFGKLAIVDPECASVGQMMYYILKDMGVPFDSDIAVWLLTALYFDTGSFQHSNTTAEVLRVAAELMQYPANHAQIAYELFQRRPYALLKLWGLTLSKLKINQQRAIAWVFLSRSELDSVGATFKDLDGLIALIHGIPDVKLTVVMSERENGQMKGSIRTVDGVDASYYAGIFGGGGHKKAAGFSAAIVDDNVTLDHIERFLDYSAA